MLARQSRWYKDAVIYETHVRAFHDSVGDGMGDFRGLEQKLDYLQDLGVTVLWLLPFYPSPLRDDGYDIADYTSIHPDYGTLDDFRAFLNSAHARGLRVITELVVNHTSEQHPWFQRARRAPAGSSERNFYVWTDDPEKYAQARVIFQDFETSNWAWDKVAKAYYWHRFYSHQPDLNYDNPDVAKALLPVVDFWFDMGVDGLRLDAVPYLFEREGTNCENLPETHEFLKALRRHVDEKYPDRMLLAEANQWPEDAVAYFGDGDECHMAFHFPVMPRLFMAIHSEDRLPIVDIMEQTPSIPENCQWALFLRNHDELTLEMVTDEERDSMYRAYALDPRAKINLGIRHRLAPLLRNNRRRIELMNALLFSLPGAPVLYYGDEIGMGDNIYLGDRNGVRTPMQWSADRNAGFSRANPQKLYLPIIIDPEYHYEAVNVEAQQNNPNSLLWWTKRLIGLRRMHPAFSRGTLEFLRPLNRRVLAFLRKHESETLLVVANLSRFAQSAELDLSAFEGQTPVELFGGTAFPAIGKQSWPLMLGPHSFYWFSLTRETTTLPAPAADGALPAIGLPAPWERLTAGSDWLGLENALARYLKSSVFSHRRQALARVHLRDSMPFPFEDGLAQLLILEIEWTGRDPENCWLPVALVAPESIPESANAGLDGRIARVDDDAPKILCDATWLPAFTTALIRHVHGGRRRTTTQRELAGVRTAGSWEWPPEGSDDRSARRARHDQRSHSLLFDESFVMNLLPRVAVVSQPELDLGRWLTESKQFPHAPRWLGSLEFRRRRDQPMTLASVYEYVPNQGDAWQFTLDELSLFYDRVLALREPHQRPPALSFESAASPETALPAPVAETLGGYLDMARLMAERLADLHRVCATADDPAFAPEEFGTQYKRSVYQTMRNMTSRALHELRQSEAILLPESRAAAQDVLRIEPEAHERFRQLVETRLDSRRIRIHGDFHLGQMLRSGSGFVLVGFEASSRTAVMRRVKQTPLYDVVGMLHSFDFAASSALNGVSHRRGRSVGIVRPEDYDALSAWTAFWRSLVQRVFLEAWGRATASTPALAVSDAEADLLIDVYLLKKSLSELRTQIIENPAGVGAALESILRCIRRPVRDEF